MKKVLLAVTAATSIFALSACSGGENEVVVESKFGDFTKADVYDSLKEIAGQSSVENIVGQMMLVKALEDKYDVTDKEVDERFKKEKEAAGENFEMMLSYQGMTEEAYKNNLRINLLFDKAADEIKIDKDKIDAEYDKMAYDLKARHILINVGDEETVDDEDKKLADEVYQKLKNGEDFATLAKKYSKDEASAKNGGDLGTFSAGTMVAEFEDAAYKAEINKFTEPVKSQYGYHIIEVTERVKVKDAPKLEDVESDIKYQIASENGQLNEKISQILKDANVKVKDQDIKNAMSQFITDDSKDKEATSDKSETKEEK